MVHGVEEEGFGEGGFPKEESCSGGVTFVKSLYGMVVEGGGGKCEIGV